MSKALTKVKGLLLGRIATNISDSLLYIAVLWYFNETFHSPLMLSLVFIISSGVDIMSFMFGPFIDKIDGRKALIIGSMCQAVISLIMGIILLSFRSNSDSIFIALLMLVGYLLSIIISTLIYPIETKMLPSLVEKEDLTKINSVFQASYKTLDLFLNAIGTMLITFVSINSTLIISGIIFSIAAKLYQSISKIWFNKSKSNLSSIKERQIIKSSLNEYKNELLEGFIELKSQTELLKLIIPLVFTNLFYGMAMVSLPRFSQFYLSKSAIGYGILLTFTGIGGVMGAALMSKLNIHDGNRKIFIFYTFVGAGIAWLMLPISITFFMWGSLFFALISSVCISMMNIMFMVLVQKTIPEYILGRVATINESILSLMIPLGNFLGGITLLYSVSLSQYLYAFSMVISAMFYLPKNYKKIK